MVNRLVFMLFVFFSFLVALSNQKYQQCRFLSGKDEVAPNYGETGKFSDEASIGGVRYSTSFLVNQNTEILIFFGLDYSGEKIDQAWKYSLEANQWQFLKGRKSESREPIFNSKNVFESTNQIAQRVYSSGWKNDDHLITIFGGETSNHLENSNELWRYNVSANEYSVLFYPDTYEEQFSNFTSQEEYDSRNIIAGRSKHIAITINDDEVFIFGGRGFASGSNDFLNDYIIYSNAKNQYKLMGGDSSKSTAFYEETNTYSTQNYPGPVAYHQATKINDEEVLIFGGNNGGSYHLNTLIMYNISKNQWKYVSGGISNFGQNYSRNYNDNNIPGGRIGHIVLKINDNEVITFGGIGQNADKYGILADEFTFNFKQMQWKFSGKEPTQYINRYQIISSEDQIYSEDELFGSIANFVAEYIEEKKEIIVCNGFGYNFFEKKLLDSCWRLYLGNICNSLEENDENVCSKKGKCSSYNQCDCEDGYYGSFCELSECNGILSNETELVCAGNGICSNSRCFCDENSIYINSDCSVDEELKNVVDNLWIFISIPIIVVISVLIFVVIMIFVIILCLKLKTTLKKFDGIDDIDLVLQEAKIDQQQQQENANKPKLEINKSLFEIDYKDLKLLSILGEGGSLSCVYLCEWKNNYCAYKGFRTVSGLTSSDNSSFFEEFEREVKIFSSINHPSILQFYGACINPPRIGMVLQYCSLGDVPSFLNKYNISNRRKYPTDQKIRILREIASGMHYLHSLNILHRDLKPENVLIDDNENSKIMDFGLAKLRKNEERTMTKQIGTSFYMAPEVYKGSKYSEKCDVFSFAILVYVVISENFFPYGFDQVSTSQTNLMKKVATSPSYRPNINIAEFKDENLKFLITLLKKNWNDDPKKRNSFKELVEILSKEEKIQRNGTKKEIIPNKKKDKLSEIKKEYEERIENLTHQKEQQALEIKNLKQKLNELKPKN